MFAVILAVLENAIMYFQLKIKKCDLPRIVGGMPGYLNSVYIQWCKENKLDYKNRLCLRFALWINLLIAIVITSVQGVK